MFASTGILAANNRLLTEVYVHKVTRLFCYFLLLILPFAIGCMVYSVGDFDPLHPAVIFASFFLLVLITAVIALYGERKKIPVLFLPYLILQTFASVFLALTTIDTILLAIIVVLAPHEVHFHYKSPDRFDGTVLRRCLIAAVFFGLACIVNFYFGVYIANRSRVLIQRENKRGKKGVDNDAVNLGVTEAEVV